MNQETTQVIVGGVEQTAPRVTIEQIEAEIESEHCFTAWDGVLGELASDGVVPNMYEKHTTPQCLQRTLFCVLVLKNGMRVEGVNHGSVSAANYSVEYARKDAREKAINQLWPMFGFELAQGLYREKQVKAADASSLGSRVSDEMVSRFLSWKLPQDFAPDCYIKFDKVDRVYADRGTWPTGTNLFTADQAKQMLQHVLGAK